MDKTSIEIQLVCPSQKPEALQSGCYPSPSKNLRRKSVQFIGGGVGAQWGSVWEMR